MARDKNMTGYSWPLLNLKILFGSSILLLSVLLVIYMTRFENAIVTIKDILYFPHDAETCIEDEFSAYSNFVSGTEASPKEDYRDVLGRQADGDGVILLALIDTGFLDMTFNFIETSLWKFNITNYLFIASDPNACHLLRVKNVTSCYVYMTATNSDKASVYGSAVFKEKMNIRTYMILEALRYGFTVLHSDVDIVYLQDPLKDIKKHITKFTDMAILWDCRLFNAGFLYAKPTSMSILVYEHMNRTAHTTNWDDQRALNAALEVYNSSLTKITLPPEQYLCGKSYFQSKRREFVGDNPCDGCIVVHNNWIVTKEAKRYRFKEVHLWMYDGEKLYYTDPARKFITYTNTVPKGKRLDLDVEIRSLKTALYFGHLLNRTVILPRFHPKGPTGRPLNTFLKIYAFDCVFKDHYRENTYLQHPKVPDSIKFGKSKSKYWIKTKGSLQAFGGKEPKGVSVIASNNASPQKQDILEWFGHLTVPVLQFESFHGLYQSRFSPIAIGPFGSKLKHAFKRSKYLQI